MVYQIPARRSSWLDSMGTGAVQRKAAMGVVQRAACEAQTIGQRIRRARLAQGMYQYQLADRAGTCQSVIKNLERDERMTNMYTFIEIARALNQSLDYLVYGTHSNQQGV